MSETVQVDFLANADDFLADAKKVQAAQDQLAAKLKAAGVSQSAYNKAVANASKVNQQQVVTNTKVKFSFTEVASAVNLVQQGLRIAGQVYDATAGETMRYAEQVRNLSAISGTSA